MLKNKIKKISVKSSLDLFWIKLIFIFSKKFGISFEDIDVRSGTMEPKLSISKKTKNTVRTTRILALKNKIFGKNLKIFMKFFNLRIIY